MGSTIQLYKISRLSLIIVVVLTFFSCKKDNTASETILGDSRLLVVNGSPSSSSINLFWTGNKLNKIPLVYGNNTGYCNITSGSREIQVKANTTNKLLATNAIKFIADSSYTIFVYEFSNAIKTVVVEDDLSIPSFGNAKFRFANMSSGLSSADLMITNGPIISSSISFGTIDDYVELKAGTYNLTLLLHGTNTVLLNLPNIRMDNSKIYTIWSSGSVNGTGASALAEQTIIQ